MLLKIDFHALGSVRQVWKGIRAALFVNWAVKPFSMVLRISANDRAGYCTND